MFHVLTVTFEMAGGWTAEATKALLGIWGDFALEQS